MSLGKITEPCYQEVWPDTRRFKVPPYILSEITFTLTHFTLQGDKKEPLFLSHIADVTAGGKE